MMKLWKNDKGGLYVYSALAIVPIIAFIGLSIDMSRAYHARAMVVSATDAAALAAAKVPADQAKAEAKRVFDAYLAGTSIEKNGVLDSVKINKEEGYIQVSGSSNLNLSFLKILGYKELKLSGFTRVATAGQTVEVALVLDNTGSMRHWISGATRMKHLQDAVKLLLDILYPDEVATDDIFVSLVPYITQVNVGPRIQWLTAAGRAMVNNPTYFPNKKWGGWQGCLQARLENNLHLSDTPPTSESTRFLPYWWASTLIHDYPFGVGGKKGKKKGKKPWQKKKKPGDNDWKPKGGITSWRSTSPKNPNAGCPVETIPLTNNKKQLLLRVKDMFPLGRGGTFMFSGLKVGMWTLSPRWKKLWYNENPHALPKNYEDSKKVLILMADGHNEWIGSNGPWEFFQDRHYTSYGRLFGPKHAKLNQDVLRYSEMNKYTLQWCDLIKRKGVTIYTISFGISNSTARDVMKACASDISNYFDATSGADLTSAFREIADRVQKLRLAWHGSGE